MSPAPIESQARDVASPDGLSALFHPRAVAVLGASGRAGNPFARPLHYLNDFGFAGEIYPVNPGYAELAGRPCYPSLADLPRPVDLVLMLVPAALVIDELSAAAAAGARAVVVFASGFAEIGPEGRELQDRLRDTAKALGIRVLGPNCQGVLETHDQFFGTFTASLETGPVRIGTLAYVGQSGAVGGSILSLAQERGLGIAAWASTGNQADLTSVELAQFLAEEPSTQVIAMYLESGVDERRFRELAQRVQELGKSLLVLRSGVSEAGARAAASHTGAIVGNDAAYRVIVRDHGVIEAEDIDDLIALAHAHTSLPAMRGRRVAVVTTSGGAGSLAADQLERQGLEVGELMPETREALWQVVPSFGAVDNPVDVTAQIFHASDPTEFVEVCDRVLLDPSVDGVMITLTLVTGTLATRMAAQFADRWKHPTKPMALVWLAAREQTADARRILGKAGWPVYDSTRQAASVLRSLVRAPLAVQASADSDPHLPAEAIARLITSDSGVLTEAEGDVLLGLAGVSRPKGSLARTAQEASEIAAGWSGPSVLKIQSRALLHKSDRGGVRLGVPAADVPAEFADLMASFATDEPLGVLVQEQAPEGVELIVGITRADAESAPLLTVGLGGFATEIFRDTTTAFAPVSPVHAADMVRSLTAAPLLTGFRGSEPIDLTAAAEAISRLSHLALAVGDSLTDLEVNPLRIDAEGGRALALDFMLLRRTTQDPASPPTKGASL